MMIQSVSSFDLARVLHILTPLSLKSYEKSAPKGEFSLKTGWFNPTIWMGEIPGSYKIGNKVVFVKKPGLIPKM